MVMNKIKRLLTVLRNMFTLAFVKQAFDALSELALENARAIRKMNIGKQVPISSTARITNPQNISIGDRSNINRYCVLLAGKDSRIIIGNDCLTGPGVIIVASKYHVQGRDIIRSYPDFEKDVIIEDDVWLGANVVVLPGVKLAKGCIIGAGSVVTRDTEPYSIYTGVPAQKIKERNQVNIK